MEELTPRKDGATNDVVDEAARAEATVGMVLRTER